MLENKFLPILIFSCGLGFLSYENSFNFQQNKSLDFNAIIPKKVIEELYDVKKYGKYNN